VKRNQIQLQRGKKGDNVRKIHTCAVYLTRNEVEKAGKIVVESGEGG
jgi:hypothetical protein